jgi:hypothetical protein
MAKLTTSNVKKVLIRGVFVAALTALAGSQATALADQGEQLWSVVVHFRYADGFEYDYVLQRGVSTHNLPAALAECARSHSTGSVVEYHCYPVAE